MSDQSPIIAAINSLPPLREVIAAHSLQATRSLGQNFLLDMNITDKIARLAGDLSQHTVVEIGPGPGGLTRSLLKAGAGKVIAVEFDSRAVRALESLVDAAQGRLSVVESDALCFDIAAATPDARRMIVANLPYNIATPLVIGWLKHLRKNPAFADRMLLMFQREVADRLAAVPGHKNYGRLSIAAQWICTVKRAYDLPASAFTPPPKITSSIVDFVPRLLPAEDPSFEALEAITAAAFGQRRKMLRSSLGGMAGLLQETGIPGNLRAEELSVNDFIRLAQALEA